MRLFAAILLAATVAHPGHAFNSQGRPLNSGQLVNSVSQLKVASEDLSIQDSTEVPPFDTDIAAQFTITVCTSTSCTRKLKEAGLGQYDVLGELYAQAQSVNLEKSMTIEDGGCQGGRNCKLGPCVGITHEDFDGNVALEGMHATEFRESVFHNVLTPSDAARVWGCMENAVSLMTEEANENDEGSCDDY